ncbi:MAG: transglutaminase-like domain-containing protein [Holophagaceae bacterium]
MHPFRFLPLLLGGLVLLGQAPPDRTFRQWMGGTEVGGSTVTVRTSEGVRELRSREWMTLARLGQEIKQDLEQAARKHPDGALSFTWRLQLSSEPFEGVAHWTPGSSTLRVQPVRGPESNPAIPAGALLWPEDLDDQLMASARRGLPLRATTFSFPTQQWSTLNLKPRGPAPLPGFPDAVRFTGTETQGTATLPVEVWISPTQGELRHVTDLGSLRVLTQRTELPPPAAQAGSSAEAFEQTLQTLPPHPFQPWLSEVTLRAEGKAPELREDAQQARLPGGRWRLRRAAEPRGAEATQPPVQGKPTAVEARYLASSALVPFEDPAFEGLLRRLALPPGLSRWELARRVNAFVFDWIADKDFSVGFASALEVCHQPRGDCSEHGVLAVALLRRLGVPARGVTGWVALDQVLGLHFWVEVRLQDRWVPIDPTFDQAPASAFRIKLGDSDLADLGSIGWEGAALALTGLRWLPERAGSRPYAEGATLRSDLALGPGGLQLRLPGGRWSLRGGRLQLRTREGGPWRVEACLRPTPAQTATTEALAGAASGRRGRWDRQARTLWLDLGAGRWLRVDGVDEAEAFDLLDQVSVATSGA